MVGSAALLAVSPSVPQASGNRPLTVPGEPSPALARLFTPPQAPAGAYEVRVLGVGIEDARRRLWQATMAGEPGSGEPERWRVQELDPLEAFGTAGSYPRTTIARLYTGRHASVVRAPIVLGGRTVAAVTLVSPYPDPTCSRLEPGTMAIVLRIAE